MGTPWTKGDARRLYSASRAKSDRASFASDDLRELMSQAIVATSRKVAEALADSAGVRQESERADALDCT